MHGVTGPPKTLESLIDSGQVRHWATMLAARYLMPARSEEFHDRIVGALSEQAVVSRSAPLSDSDVEGMFRAACRGINDYVGLPMVTVSTIVRNMYRDERLQKTAAHPALDRAYLVGRVSS